MPTAADVDAFIAAVPAEAKRADAARLDALFRDATGEAPRMWGPTIIGYGQYRYRYDSGHEGVMCRVGFSPRAAKHSLYLMACGDAEEQAAFAPLLARLGRYKAGKSCLYVNKLADVDEGVLAEMIALGWQNSLSRWPD